MKKVAVLCWITCLTVTGFAGFKVKLIKPKKAEQFEARTSTSGVTFAADLLLDGGEQKDFFYKELAPSNIIAVRLAVFNGSKTAVTLPLAALKLTDPDGKDLQLIPPETVARAMLGGMVVSSQRGQQQPSPNTRPGTGTVNRTDPRYDPRRDRNDPRYDPRTDPSDPRYNPRTDPNDPRYDPGMDPNDPRNDPTNPYPGSYPGGSGYPGQQRYPGGWGGPGIVLNPGGGGGAGDLSQFEKQLVEKDFNDKAHTEEPVLPSLSRDRFLYFLVPGRPANLKGYTLQIPAGKGMPQEIVLRF
jgi:hypothetical protein